MTARARLGASPVPGREGARLAPRPVPCGAGAAVPAPSLAVEHHNARGEQRGVRARAQLLRPAQQRTATIHMTQTCAVRKDAGVLHASNRLAAFPAPTAGLVPRAKAGPTDIRALRVLATTCVPPARLRLAHRAGHPAESEHHRLRQRQLLMRSAASSPVAMMDEGTAILRKRPDGPERRCRHASSAAARPARRPCRQACRGCRAAEPSEFRP